ncbi:putative transporter [Fontivita pretiosa]|uniref:putative transporter n=1 Tax=Fontivita pretiosa TaxID=2989684 RepID=UPI003D166D4D
MNWLIQLVTVESVAQAVVILCLVAGTGLALGSIRVFNVSLGIAGVLFSGLAAGDILHRAQIEINAQILEFAREFGLILFVYTIGVQVGPGFIASLRRQGLKLNLLAGAIVVAGAVLTVAIWYWGRVPLPAAVGLYAGATTNTPSLAAAQQALKDLSGTQPADLALPGMGYAVAYPFGIVGIILTMLLTRWIFRINPQAESEELARLLERDRPRLSSINLEVKNPNLDGLELVRIPTLAESGVVISRIMSGGRTFVPMRDTKVHLGDVLHAVGPRDKLEALRLIVGAESKVDVKQLPGNITARRILVTKPHVLGETVADLNLAQRFGVIVTRVARAEVELPPHGTPLQFGDTVVVVGEEEAIKRVAAELGDSVKQLNHPQVIPIFIGIALGVVAGMWPLHLPGVPAAVRLGLAGGPLIVAILLSRLGNVGPIIWYMPASANFMLRELGIVLFLACVGIRSGGRFLETLTQGDGFYWMGLAAIITFAPLMLVAMVARIFYKVNYLTLCGLLAGSMTDPPALAFAGHMTGSDAPSVSYATVYPLVMLLRVLTAQVLVVLLAS